MDAETFEMLWKAITPLQAEEMSINVEASAFPHLKKESRKTIQKKIERASRVDFEETVHDKRISTEQLAKMLSRSLNG